MAYGRNLARCGQKGRSGSFVKYGMLMVRARYSSRLEYVIPGKGGLIWFLRKRLFVYEHRGTGLMRIFLNDYAPGERRRFDKEMPQKWGVH